MIATLFSLRARHAFFADGAFATYDLVPDAATARAMRRFGLMRHRVDGRWLVSCGDVADVRARLSYLAGAIGVLRFVLCGAADGFHAITRMPDGGRLPFLLSSGRGGSATSTGARAIAPDFDSGLRPEDDVLGHFEVDLAALAAAGESPVAFEASFEAREVGWRYYVINARGSALREPFIKDRQDRYLDGPHAVTMPNGETALRFDSGTQVFALRQHPDRIFDLYAKGGTAFEAEDGLAPQCLIKGLPTPRPSSMSLEADQAGASGYSAMFVYV